MAASSTTNNEVPASVTGRATSARANSIRGFLNRNAVFMVIAMLLVFALIEARPFFNPFNLRSVGTQAAILGIVAVGQALVLLVRGLDLSVGAVAAVMAMSLASTSAVPEALLIGFGVAAAVGLINGLLVTRFDVAPFVATLGTLIALEGARLAVTDGQASGAVPAFATYVGRATITFLPVAVLVWAALLAAVGLLLARTMFGRRVYATGSSPEAARLSGVATARTTVLAYVLCSLCAALAGLVLTGSVGYVDQSLGSDQNLNLNSIAAAVLGGYAFTGGEGRLIGTIAGAVLLVVVSNLILVLGLPIQLQLVAQGTVLVGAVLLVAHRRA